MQNSNAKSTPQGSPGILNRLDWLKIGEYSFSIFTRPIIEVIYGLRSKRIPLGECLLSGGMAGSLIAFRFDQFIWKKIGILSLYPRHLIPYYSYCALVLLSGLWSWGLFQTYLRTRLIQRLTDVLIGSGLTSPLGRLPAFIFDRPIDEFTRKLRLGRAGLSKFQFEKAKPALESNLQVYIDEVRENRESGSIDFIYSHSPMPEITKLDDVKAIPSLSFVVGKTRAKEIQVSLRTVPHLLVAGQTGGGKSTFLRAFITTLFLNNPDLEFTLIDLKGGLEFQTFENLNRVRVIPGVPQAVASLKYLESTLKDRMALLKGNGCKDIDAYYSIPEAERKTIAGVSSRKLNRHILVVDEAAEMFLAGSHASSGEIQSARRVLSQIARQGRSCGVHIIVATQRPDARALDPQVKSNLTGVLCFQMLNDASSITVLGVGRATELPAIPGRAIWKSGSDMMEVQTPYLTTEETDQLLESHRVQNQIGVKPNGKS